MTDDLAPPPATDDGPTDRAPPNDAPPDGAPPGVASSIGLGCAGFVGFFLLALVASPVVLGLGPVGAAIVGVLLVGLAVHLVRSATPYLRARILRVAIGFGVAAVVFGGCLALIANANFH